MEDKKSHLALELHELGKISNGNKNQISKLQKHLHALQLSITLLKEEQQRLQHSQHIRTFNMKLLANMVKGRNQNELKTSTNEGRIQEQIDVLEKLFKRFSEMEELKMRLEYGNTRDLYTIRDLKEELTKLENNKRSLLKVLNLEEGNVQSSIEL